MYVPGIICRLPPDGLFQLIWLVEKMMTETNLPPGGVVFWPVGTGDSTTLVVDDEHVLQVDLRDMALADEPDSAHAQVIDRLAEVLPERDGAPYLSVFALTHADQDHCTGFGDLLDSEILIGAVGDPAAVARVHRGRPGDVRGRQEVPRGGEPAGRCDSRSHRRGPAGAKR